MSLLFTRDLGDTSSQLTPPRTRSIGTVTVSADSALRHSAVWACLRLRADLISTLPVDVYRNMMVNGSQVQVEAASTPFLADPAGSGFGINDWLYAGQFDLDRVGNSFGVIKARDAMGYPALVELTPFAQVRIHGKGPKITKVTIAGTEYDYGDVWHERQFPVSGIPLGLTPIGYAAMSIGTYLSAQQFAADWFTNGAIPAAKLKNTAKTISPKEAQIAKDRFKAAVGTRDIFVTGADWDYDMISVAANESQFLESMRYGVLDVARFMGVPGDLIDAEAQSSAKISYANITQRNLQLLVMNLGPTIIRRENALSKTLPRPRFVKLNTDAFLRMDPQTRATMFGQMVKDRTLAPSEARALDNRQPFTEEQLAEFDRLFGKSPPPGMKSGVTP